jgi:hypothetical protein
MSVKMIADNALNHGEGILKLSPTWVPRSFCIPGRRIKLHPDDYYALGGERGGIDERWFASTTPADNGPLTSKDEGLSHIVFRDGKKTEKILLRDAISELKSEIIGERLWNQFNGWTMYSKFFDNLKALPFHIHHNDKYAQLTGQLGKPEAYYFPPQVNNHGGDFPYTFFGLNPGTTKDQVRICLENFSKGVNKITDLSRAQALRVGTGWDVPPGLLHAPGSLCTYEPQKASDVFAMYESITGDTVIPEELLWKNTPENRIGDFDFLLDVIDWEMNLDPNFVQNRKMTPIQVNNDGPGIKDGYIEYWICYKSSDFSAKELTVLPGQNVTIKDSAAYGMILMQGHGKMGKWSIDTPAMIRYGQETNDEFFISEEAASRGVIIQNHSDSDPLVMLKHFGPNNPDLSLDDI